MLLVGGMPATRKRKNEYYNSRQHNIESQEAFIQCSDTKCGRLEKAWEKSMRRLNTARRRTCGKETPEEENGGAYWKCADAASKRSNTRKRYRVLSGCQRIRCRKEWKALL